MSVDPRLAVVTQLMDQAIHLLPIQSGQRANIRVRERILVSLVPLPHDAQHPRLQRFPVEAAVALGVAGGG